MSPVANDDQPQAFLTRGGNRALIVIGVSTVVLLVGVGAYQYVQEHRPTVALAPAMAEPELDGFLPRLPSVMHMGGHHLDSLVERFSDGKEAHADLLTEAIEVAGTHADVCEAVLADPGVRQALVIHRVRDPLTERWYREEREHREIRDNLAMANWGLLWLEAAVANDASTAAPQPDARAALATARDTLARKCPWPGWEAPHTLADAGAARTQQEPCGRMWQFIDPGNTKRCNLDTSERGGRQAEARWRLHPVLDAFDAACNASLRCRDDDLGRERVRRPLNSLLDDIGSLDDRALSSLVIQLEYDSIDDYVVSLIPPDHYLLPAALPIDPYPQPPPERSPP